MAYPWRPTFTVSLWSTVWEGEEGFGCFLIFSNVHFLEWSTLICSLPRIKFRYLKFLNLNSFLFLLRLWPGSQRSTVPRTVRVTPQSDPDSPPGIARETTYRGRRFLDPPLVPSRRLPLLPRCPVLHFGLPWRKTLPYVEGLLHFLWGCIRKTVLCVYTLSDERMTEVSRTRKMRVSDVFSSFWFWGPGGSIVIPKGGSVCTLLPVCREGGSLVWVPCRSVSKSLPSVFFSLPYRYVGCRRTFSSFLLSTRNGLPGWLFRRGPRLL